MTLGYIGTDQAFEVYWGLAQNPDHPLYLSALTTVGYFPRQQCVPVLCQLIRDPDMLVRYYATRGLTTLQHGFDPAIFIPLLDDSFPDVRYEASIGCTMMQVTSVQAQLKQIQQEHKSSKTMNGEYPAYAATMALATLFHDHDRKQMLDVVWEGNDLRVQMPILQELYDLDNDLGRMAIAYIFHTGTPDTRFAVLQLIANLNDPMFLHILLPWATDWEFRITFSGQWLAPLQASIVEQLTQ